MENTVETASPSKKSYIRTLVNAAGTQKLQAFALKAKEGFTCYIVHSKVTGKGKTEMIARGATTKAADYAAAVVFVDEALVAGVKAGWIIPEGPKGYVAAPDTFSMTNLPAPAAAAPAAKQGKGAQASK